MYNNTNDKKKFSLSTLFRRVNRRIVPQINGDNTDKQSDPVLIFIGTWNMGFKKLENKHFCNDYECNCLSLKTNKFECSCSINLQDPLDEWISLNYDIYFITLQESVCPNFFDIISKFLEKSKHTLIRIPIKNDKIMGFGAGAYVTRKMTSIAIWVRKDLLESESVMIGPSKSVYLSTYNRSKGVLCFQIKIFEQILCFIGCHMPSDFMERQKACLTVLEKLSGLFGANESLTFKDVFHHVIWAGDFNFKLTMGLDKVISSILNGTIDQMLKYDEFYLTTSVLKDQNFCEDIITFDPTYKKKENRKVLDKQDKDWFIQEYSTSDIKWYNGNAERVPSWTDRILKWSDESMESCLVFKPKTYKAVIPKTKSPLLISDHTPVSCGFCLRPVVKSIALPVKLNVHTCKPY